ncbi:hypothetical protein BU23DRAFT_246818 [Bimuria novae-zelandiae CBS 107.79]|uniref:BAH-domain-containing protein n=1 Tax=Bimuria novae-zelandiae CBS 107.79 TaxID=1447943 RepID=A0A6A5UVZ3_9PLEO|nr:hypothetical protein BU23DRAFT_246818 [Bimuria novae-zelandiae CBS 107.79]
MVDVRNGGREAASTKLDKQFHADARRTGGSTLDIISDSNAPDGMAPSKASSKTSSTRTSTPAAASLEDAQPSRTTDGSPAPHEQAPQSQPMSATVSSSSNATAKEPKDTPAAPYGTRSRNRPERASRINYAEDVEMDFEMAATSTNGNGSDPSSRASAATENGQSTGPGGKKGSGATQGNASWGASGPNPKDIPPNANIPGTSTFTTTTASTPAPQPKRRKNAANHATNASHANAAPPSQPGARRAQNAGAAASSVSPRETNMMTFENMGARLKGGCLVADDGQTIAINDQVYLVCEPPGEPYYLCRVMEFIHANHDPSQKVEMVRVNWFYRPRDVQRSNPDTRLVFATMHSDLCPLTSLRGKCQILHRSEIDDIDEYRKNKDSFWFNQVFDRFIHRWYEVIPVSQVINVPDKVKKALDERWKYICLETSRVKELTSAVKSCKRCVGFCASNDSVECAVCHNTYHMNCVRPPLLKKPSRGFAWACGPCSRAQEKKLEARRTPLVGSGNEEGDDEEIIDEEEEEEVNGETTAPSPNDSETHLDLHPGTQAEIALAKMWPMRYLGIHCRVEDALQYDDRAIYPRASSRLGPRHQANVNVWHGRPVELVKPAEIKKRYVKSAGHKKDTKLSKETVAAIEADKAEKAKRPKWVMDEPPGYVRRGEDYPNKDSRCTAELTFKMPPLGVHSTRGEDNSPTITPEQVESYMTRAKNLARGHVGVEPWSTNFLTKCLALLTKHQYDVEAALKAVKKLDKRKDLKEPELTKEEEKKWNEGVSKYGSEIRNVRLHTSKTMHYGDAVRYYYMWKKTAKGREIWGSYSNRKGKSKKTEGDSQTRLLDDLADDQDDSAFDNEKAVQRKRHFQCKFCGSRHSRRWRRAPGAAPGQTVTADGRTSKDKANGYVVALCQRCANLWRKYAIKWENTDEIARKVAQGGGKAWKRRFDEELLREVYAATTDPGPTNSVPEHVEPAAVAQVAAEPPKKKQKVAAVAAADSGASTPVSEPAPKKKEKEKPVAPPKAPTPPPVPAQPRLRVLPCAVCRRTEGVRLECAACKMNVHKACYGIEETRQANKWYCDTCKNDKKESVSYNYECVLCPLRTTEPELYEPPKISHKKKTDREREKERMEKELVEKAKEDYRARQQEKGRPVVPREALKRTADNNWVHVHCALWHPELKFRSVIRLDMVEGVGAPTLRYDAMCKLCKTNDGACVTCQQCHANFHVGCAHNAGYIFGFDMTPVKATRRDAVPTATLNGETGTMTAAIWCKDHVPKTVVHPMYEEVEGTELTALQLFAREFKQADLTLTGTVRKANLVDQSTRIIPPVPAPATQGNRRTSLVATQTPLSARGRQSNAGVGMKEEESQELIVAKPERKCVQCKIDASPRWWKVEEATHPEQTAVRVLDGPSDANGSDSSTGQMAEHTPQTEHTSTSNGNADQSMTDAPPVAPPDLPTRLRVDTDVQTPPPAAYLCQKCHWKKLNAPDEPEERQRSTSVHGEAQQLPLRSPPVQPFVAPPPPPTLAGPWGAAPQQPLPLSHWHSAGHPGPMTHPPPPQSLYNGIGHPLPGPLGHHPPYHAPYNPVHQANGYPAYSGPPPVHAHIPSGPSRGHYGPAHLHNGPPPLHLTNGGMMVNGMHSPHVPYSPTHAPGHNSSRSTESPYNAPPPLSYSPLHHGSPAPGGPPTPRDAPMRDAPVVTAPPLAPPPLERVNTGASASPSLRNLLH